MPEEMKYEITQQPAQIAARLRKLADELETGKVTVVEQEVEVAEYLKLKIEFEEQYGGDAMFEIEIEIAWPVEAEDD